MYFRINSADESCCSFGIDFITIELEPWNCKSESFFDISANSDNIPLHIICISYERGSGFPDNSHSRECLCRGNFYPFGSFKNHPIIRNKTGHWTENLFLSEFIVDFYGSVRIFRAHFIDRCNIKCIFHRYFYMYRSYIDCIFTIEYTGFFLSKYDISRYRFDSEFRRYCHIGFRYREIEYEREE